MLFALSLTYHLPLDFYESRIKDLTIGKDLKTIKVSKIHKRYDSHTSSSKAEKSNI